MTLTDEQLDALAERLMEAGRYPLWTWTDLAREAARWAEEQQGGVVWEANGDYGWEVIASGIDGAIDYELAGIPVRAIRVIATTTKEGV